MKQIYINCSLKKIKLQDSMFGMILGRVFTIPMLGKRKMRSKDLSALIGKLLDDLKMLGK